ncbi:MAG: DUF3782 domain-containing protein [Magnetococcales bacterium]|nr:DUF3782 domain-containing protein [Magnetococcales bacterium]NGZ05618.1 DUF3782 domain-containing protein [Magnetococcales bacterium]
MSQAVTFDDVWKMFQENAQQLQETRWQFQEMVRESRERGAELDRRMQETDRKIQEVARQMKETDRKLDRLGGRLGEFVEGLVAPACKTLFAQRGIPVHKVSRRVEADLPEGRHMEIDLFVVNTDSVALVEVKSKLTVDDVREHVRRMDDFKEFFPEYADKRAVGAVSAMVIDEHVARFAIKQGLFVIEQAGDTLRMANDDDFIPKCW